jgi:hypothetical protein
MALEDMKSNLAKGAGRPKGNPSGNIKDQSPIDRTLTNKLGKLNGKDITSDVKDVPKYKEFTADGEKS